MKKKHLFLVLTFLFFAFIAATFRPIIVPSNPAECIVAEGKVSKIFEGGIKDVVFKLEGHDTYYYINRGLEQGLELNQLQEDLIGNNVTIKYPKHWTLFNINKASRHLSILEYDGKEIFNEIKLLYPEENG